MLIDSARSFLLVVDVQEKLIPAIHDRAAVVDAIEWLLGVAHELDVPVRASEQYPKGLGHTIERLAERLPEGSVTAKSHFSCADAPECYAEFERLGRPQAVVCGIEAHVCVLQSALGLKQRGYEVFVVADAIGSRDPRDRELAIARMQAAGVSPVSREMVAFEWMHRAGTPEFKRISQNYLR